VRERKERERERERASKKAILTDSHNYGGWQLQNPKEIQVRVDISKIFLIISNS
jgi:hypothetical protein